MKEEIIASIVIDDNEKEMRIPAGRTSFSLNLKKQVNNCYKFFQKFGT